MKREAEDVKEDTSPLRKPWLLLALDETARSSARPSTRSEARASAAGLGSRKSWVRSELVFFHVFRFTRPDLFHTLGPSCFTTPSVAAPAHLRSAGPFHVDLWLRGTRP